MYNYIGLIGLGAMGENLSINIGSKNFSVSVYDKFSEKTKKLWEKVSNFLPITPTYSIEDFVKSLEKPRKIILLVPAGEPVDEVLRELLRYLDREDIVCDCGNSFYKDTERRQEVLREKGIFFMGVGISGGREGAYRGLSIMVGGDKHGYDVMRDLWEKISAKVDSEPCSGYIGERGAGHFVKMVHNGILYAILQSIAEVYDIMKNGMGMRLDDIRSVFEDWLKDRAHSYLLELTVEVLQKRDNESGYPIIDFVSDVAEQKGMGKWTSQTAMELEIPTPCIDVAVSYRAISIFRELRKSFSENYSKIGNPKTIKISKNLLSDLEKSFYLVMITSFAQGLHLIKRASDIYRYDIDIKSLLKLWRGGSVIRSSLIYRLIEVSERSSQIENILQDRELYKEVVELEDSLKNLLSNLKALDIPTPILDSTLNYLISLRRERLPTNLIQLLRDRFGYHGFERIDKLGRFHIE
ncbi:MAG: NADP-dependent phosphogluconate dehydrogenase [Aigarchaeota archaeon]|nr:NADP-dependent phosphogluconate dehydrogenase [Aigarchaeota archaeon]MDW7985903.1 NADP-dependent phosphogluconate dehydrogenase [Nitrososphaerota archaeon]